MTTEENMTALQIMIKRKAIMRKMRFAKDFNELEALNKEAQRLKRLAFKKGGLTPDQILALSVN
jgi:hypothetical protein